MHDDGNIGYTAPGANNPFDYLDGEYATSTDFQRTRCACTALYQMPWGFSTSVTVLLRLGQPVQRQHLGDAVRQAGTNRLNLTATGGPTSAITIPADGRSIAANGPAVDRRRARSSRATR